MRYEVRPVDQSTEHLWRLRGFSESIWAQADEDLMNIPPGSTVHAVAELFPRFGDPERSPNQNGLRMIHEAKKYGGRIIGEG